MFGLSVVTNPQGDTFRDRVFMNVIKVKRGRYYNPGGTVVKSMPANAGDKGDKGSVPGSGRCPGERNSNPLQYSCLEKTTDKGAQWAAAHGLTKEWI